MEKHKCKLCLKSFANGRALGGHMRSHMLNLYVTPKPPHLHSTPPSSSDAGEEDANHEIFSRKKSFRLGDPEFSFTGAVRVTTNAAGCGGGSVVLQDRESETESSRNATGRRRSKRIRRPETSCFGDQQHFREFDRNKNQNLSPYLRNSKTPESSNAEPVSSISETSPEEDLAYCLILLSRGKWTNEEEEDTEQESESDREIMNVKRPPARTKYICETCNKIFRSYQALGGHRASHKKIKLKPHGHNRQTQHVLMENKIHECPVCFKVFASGQALGGHKRSHVTASSSLAMATNKPVSKQSINLFDLNLPASIEDDDDVSQIDVSVVSDGEFVKPN